jgi:ABC-2 type transport system permease protein
MYMMNVSRGVFLKDVPAAVVFENLWPMAVIAVITLTCAAWLFRRRMA